MKKDWVEFYQRFADRLLDFKTDRKKLISIIKESYNEINMKYPFLEKGAESIDLCPFTVFGTFNKGISAENRISLLEKYKEKFNIDAPVPTGFDSIPVLNNLSAWFFAYQEKRNDDDIDNLWEFFEAAIRFADEGVENNKERFIKTYDQVMKQRQVKWNITFGLYWIRPYDYISLDSRNRNYLLKAATEYSKLLDDYASLKKPPNGSRYLELVERFKTAFKSDEVPHKDFPELSYQAFKTPFYDALKESAENPVELDTDNVNYWIYSPGRNSEYWDEFYAKNIMAIGFGDIGNLENFGSKTAIVEALKSDYDKDKTYKNSALALWQFSNEMKPGDVVYVKEGMYNLIGRGIVKGTYHYDESRTDYKHVRAMQWTHKGEWAHPGQAAIKTLTKISPYLDYINVLETIIRVNDPDDTGDGSGVEPTREYETYTEEEVLNEVFFSEAKYEMIVSILKNKQNLILQGPPGVGKTFAAKRIAYSMLGEMDKSRVKMIQFHQNYSYEDFIMGYRPTKEGFELKPGPFYEFCKTAEEDDENDYFFIIDEINRGNLSKIFGELLMLIEKDKRGESLKLMYKDELFKVPENLYVIGLMNTADRSLAIIDYALRRRFAFVDLEPEFESPNFNLIVKESNNSRFRALISQIKQLNETIEADENLGAGFKIGHSYFCVFESVTDERLEAIIRYEILPLLHEYWFDDKDKVATWKAKLLGVFDD